MGRVLRFLKWATQSERRSANRAKGRPGTLFPSPPAPHGGVGTTDLADRHRLDRSWQRQLGRGRQLESGTVPGPGDNVTIPASSVTVTIQSGDAESVSSITTGSNCTLTITGGSLTVAANSTLSGGLAMSGGSLTATGSAVAVVVNGSTTINGGSLFATAGATLSLPAATSYADPANISATWQATGAGSVLNLPNVTSVTGSTGYLAELSVQALAGGEVNLPGLTNIPGGEVALESDGSGSQLNVPLLANFQSQGTYAFTPVLQATNHGTLLDGDLQTLQGVAVVLDGTGTMATNSWTSLTSGSVTISGGTASLSGLTDIGGDSFYVSGGATLSVSAASYADPANISATWQASSAGSVLNLANATSVTGSTGYLAELSVQALAGGEVNLPALANIPGGEVALESDGPGSQLNVPLLANFQSQGTYLFSPVLQATNHGTILDGDLQTLQGVSVVLDGTGTMATSPWTSLTSSSVTISGGTASLSGLTDIDGASFYVSGGATLSVSAASYADPANISATWQASGAGSDLNLPNLTSVTGSTGYLAELSVQAPAGGEVNLPALTNIPGGEVALESDGPGHQLNVPLLANFQSQGTYLFSPVLQATNHGTLLDGDLQTLKGVFVVLDGTGTMATNSWTSLTSGSVTISGGTASLSGLTDIGGDSFYVSGGATLSLPAVTSYSEGGGAFASATFKATGAGSVLNLPNATSVTGSTGYLAELSVQALAGGEVNLPALTNIPGGEVALESDGPGSQLNVPLLANFQSQGTYLFTPALQATNHGTVLDGDLQTLQGVAVVLDGTGTMATSPWTSLTSGSVTLSGGTANLSGLTDIDGTSFYVSGGATLSVSAASYADPANLTATWQASGAGSSP